MCHNAVDRHVAAGRGDTVALVYDSPLTDTVRRITYAELQDQVYSTYKFLSQISIRSGLVYHLATYRLLPQTTGHCCGLRMYIGTVSRFLESVPSIVRFSFIRLLRI